MDRRTEPSQGPLLEVRGLTVEFTSVNGPVIAVASASFVLGEGESVGLVGESGSGKTTVLRSLAGLIRPGQVKSGKVIYRGEDILAWGEGARSKLRGGRIGLIFQDPVNCFNPAFTVGHQLRRVLRLHRPDVPRRERNREVTIMLERVGIDASGKLSRYPFQLSQGQLQRLMIAAVCLGARPELLLADEPTTSLDVTTEAQVIDLLAALRKELGMTLLLVTHNLAVAAELCDRIMVMQAGRIVEDGSAEQVFHTPAHPYTRELLNSLPELARPAVPSAPVTTDPGEGGRNEAGRRGPHVARGRSAPE